MNNIFLFIAFSLLFTTALSQNKEIVITNVLQKVNQTGSDLFYYTAKLPFEFSYLYFKVTSLDSDVFARLYVSAKSATPDYDFSEYKGIDYNNTVYYPASELVGQREITVGIECNGNCSSTLEFLYIDKDGLVQINDTSTKFDVRIAKDNNFFLVYNIVEGKKTLFSITSSGTQDFHPFVVYGESQDEGGKLIEMEKVFFNGYALVIGGTFKPVQGSSLFLWISPSNFGDIFTFEVKQLEDTDEEIYPTQLVTSVLGFSDVNTQCFSIKHDFTDPEGNAKDVIEYTLHGYSYTNNTKVSIVSADKKTTHMSKIFGSSDYLAFQVQKGMNDTARICVSFTEDKNRHNSASLQFQIFDSDRIEDITVQPYLMFLVRGLPIVSRLKPGTCAFFQVTTYAMNATELQAQMHTISGNPNLYMAISEDYPNEVIYSIDIEDKLMDDELHPSDEVNGNYFVKLDIQGTESYKVGDPVIAVVDCPYDVIHSSDCVFSLTMSNEMDQVVLLENLKFSTSIQKDEMQSYSFDINTTISKTVRIVVYSFSGDADLRAFTYDEETQLHLEVDTENYYAVGNKEYYQLSFDSQTNEVMKFYLEVTGKTNAYYSIYYSTNNDKINHIHLEPGEITMEAIDAKRENVLHFTNRDEKWSPDYIITLQAMNCDLNVTSYDGTAYEDIRELKFFIEPADQKYGSEFTVTITGVKMDTNNENDYCLVYVASGEQDIDRVLVLNEGIHHAMSVSPSIEDVYYLYPFKPRDGGDFYNELVLSITKLSEQDLNLTYFIGLDLSYTVAVRSYNRKVVIPVEEIMEECEDDDVCPIIIRVAPLKANTTVEFEIGVIGSTPSPIYLQRGDYRYDTVKSYQQIVYYSEFASGDDGEVVVDFKRGTGSVLAAMYSKEDRFEDGWNRRFPIPDKYSDYLIPFDYDNKKFVFNHNTTKTCGDEGCVIIVVVETKNSPSEEVRGRLNEFTIFTRLKYTTAVRLPENEYAFGALSTSEESKRADVFEVTIEKNTDKILIVFDSDFCKLDVTLLPDDETPLHTWEFSPFQTGSEITANFLNLTTLQGKVFYLMPNIADESFQYEDDFHYSLKVVTTEKGAKNEIIEVNSNQNEFCQITSLKQTCTFVIPVYNYYKVDFVHLFILNELNPSNRGTITARIYTETEYEEAKESGTLSPQGGNSQSSEGYINTNTLFLSLLQYEGQTVYVIALVDGKVPGGSATITFMSSFFNAWEDSSITPGTHELFRIESESETNMLIPGTDGYFVEVVVISGVGTISSKNFETIILEDEGRDSAAFIVPYAQPNTIITVKSSEDEELLFYVRYLSRPLKRNIDKILFGDSNYIEFSHNQLIQFPLVYYVEVTGLELTSDIALTVQFNNIDFISAKRSLNEMFEIEITYFNETSLTKLMTGEEKFRKSALTSYDPFFKVASAVFKDNDIAQIEGKHQFLAMRINPHSQNTNLYINLHVNVICFAINQRIIKTGIPKREYFFSSVEPETYQELKLTKGSVDDEYYNIQFFSDAVPKLHVKTSDKNEEIKSTNITEIKGKKFITLYDASNDQSLGFTVYNNNVGKKMKYVFKYETTPFPLNNSYFVVTNTKVAHEEYNNTLTLNLTAVKTAFGEVPERALYTVRIYNKGININDLDMFYYSKTVPKYTYTKINEKKDDIVTLKFEVPPGQYVASVMASVDHGYESEFLQYGSFAFDITTVDVITESGNFGIIVAIIVCVVLLIVAIIVVVQKKKTPSYKQPEVDEDTIHQINSVNDGPPEQLIP